MDHDQIGAASEIYSLGCVLFEMLVGEPPFGGPTLQAVMCKHAAEAPLSIQLVRPEVPANVDDAVMKALEKKPDDRPGSGTKFNFLLGLTEGETTA